jgi:hypothetical protein
LEELVGQAGSIAKVSSLQESRLADRSVAWEPEEVVESVVVGMADAAAVRRPGVEVAGIRVVIEEAHCTAAVDAVVAGIVVVAAADNERRAFGLQALWD